MNPSLKLILIILISFEISFTTSVSTNCGLILVATIYLLITKITAKKFAILLAIPLIPAIGLVTTIAIFSPSHNYHLALVLFTRMYAYLLLGATFTQRTDPLSLAQSLEQNLHLPSKFAYGTLAAFNLIPRIRQTVITMRKSALMRGVTLSIWSPQLYFKTIVVALNWSGELAQAMLSHGFVEDAPRTYAKRIPIKPVDWGMWFGALAILQLGLFLP